MWSKIIGFIVVLIVIASAFVLFENTSLKKNSPVKDLETDRAARNIMLYELNTDNNESSTLHAEKGILSNDRVIDLFEITVRQEDKFYITGPEARYDMENSNLRVKGDILLIAKDGSKAFFRDLTWKKSTNLINSENPVRVQNNDGWITGRKVEMTDDLSRISLSGGVHAKINPSFDING